MGNTNCKSCGHSLPSDVDSEDEELDRMVDELKVITYTCQDDRYYYIKSFESPTLGHVSVPVECKYYYCYHCFWRPKLEEEILIQNSTERGTHYLNVDAELSETRLGYLEHFRDMNGVSSVATQPYKMSITEEANKDSEEHEDNELVKKFLDIDPGEENEEDQEVDLHEIEQDLDQVFNQIIEMQPPNVIHDFELELQRSIQTSLLAIYAALHQLDDMQMDLISIGLSQIEAELKAFEVFEMTKKIAQLCKHNMSQLASTTHDYGVNDDVFCLFLKELITAGNDSCNSFIEACISHLISASLPQHDEETLNMVITLCDTQLWSSRDVLTFISLLKDHALSHDLEKLKLVLHYVQTYQISFNELRNAMKSRTDPDRLVSSLFNNFVSRTGKDLEIILQEIDTELDENIKEQIKAILSNVLKSDGSNFEAAIQALSQPNNAANSTKYISVVLRALYCGVHKCKNYYPTVTQLVSVCTLLLSHQYKTNRLLEVLTGEGKSCIIAMYAAALGMQGKTVDIVTSSDVLAKRDAETWNEYFHLFYLNASDNIETEDLLSQGEAEASERKRECYKNPIVYGTVTSFSADILRHEFELRNVRGSRGLQVVICDEVDMLMLDEGVQLTYLSHRAAVLRHVEHVLALIWSAVCHNTPLTTTTGRVLFAGAPKLFHNIIFEGIRCQGLTDSTQLLQLAVKYKIISSSTLQQMFDPKSSKKAVQEFTEEKMIQYISQLEYHLPYDFNIYIMNENNQLEQQMWAKSTHVGEVQDKKRCEFSLLVVSGGMACPLHTEEDLTIGIERIVANHLPKNCSPADIRPEGILHTENDKEYTAGVFHYFHDTIFNAIVSYSKCRLERPERILDLAVKHKLIDKQKASKLRISCNDREVINNLKVTDMLSFIGSLNVDKTFPFKVAPFIQSQHDGGKIAPASISTAMDDKSPVIYVLVKEKGLLCPLSVVLPKEHKSLHKVHTVNGRTLWRGEADDFHKVIFQQFNSTIILHLAYSLHVVEKLCVENIMKAETDAGAIKPMFLNKIVTLLNHLEKVTPYTFQVYTCAPNSSLLQLKNKNYTSKNEHCQEISLLMNGKGMFCQLHTKERTHVPTFLHTFIGNQLLTYIHSAFAALQMTEKREYVVKHGKIIPVDYQNSGVIESNKHWGGGLQQMLEMKHHLKISPISVITNFISHSEFFKRYTEIYGLSGTIGLDYELKILKELYKLHACHIPPSFKKRFHEHKEIIVESNAIAWLNEVFRVLKQETSSKHGMPGRAALVLCEDIQAVDEIEAFLWKKGLTNLHVYSRSDSNSVVVERDMTSGDIIIATNLAGRGTDIRVDSGVIKSGGLFCLLTFLPRNRRIELQAFGRTARQGNPGSAQVILFAPTLPIQFREMDLSSIRKSREEQQAQKLTTMMKTDVREVKLREELFSHHCQYLRDSKIQSIIDKREEKSAIMNCINEMWGLWLQSQQKDIRSLHRDKLFADLSRLQQKWTHSLTSPNELKYLPKGNFIYLIKLGNTLAKSARKDATLANRAIEYYDRATSIETQFTAIAYYNRAYCKLCASGDKYIESSISDLKRARRLLQILVEEVSIISQSMKTGQCRVQPKRNDKTALVSQMEARIEVLQTLADKIDHNVQKLVELQGDVDIIPTSILSLVSEPDIITQAELHGLSELGLQLVFKVEKKKHFCWAGLIVFALGILEIVAGVCLEAFTFGIGSTIGMGLISEGVSDCIDGAIGMFTGEWSWTSWATMKACSIAVSIATGGAGLFMKEVIKGAEVAAKEIPEAVEETWKQVAKTTMKTAAKNVGKQVVEQGVMRALGELENSFMEKVVKKIAEGVTGKVARSLEDCFLDQMSLGLIVDKLFTSKLPDSYANQDMMPPFLRKQAKDYFDQMVQQVVQDLVPLGSSEYGQVMSTLSDILHNTTNELTNKKSIFTALEIPLVIDSIKRATKQLVILFDDFQPRLIKESNKAISDQVVYTAGYYRHLKCVVELKRALGRRVTNTFTETVASILLDKFGWVSNQLLNRTVNQHFTKKTVDLVSAGAENLQSYAHSWSHERNIRRITNKSGIEADLQVAADHFGHQIRLLNEKGEQIRLVEPASDKVENGAPDVTLIRDEDQSYHVVTDGEKRHVTAKNGNGLFEAIAFGLNHAKKSSNHDASSVRHAVAKTVIQSPKEWNKYYKTERKREELIPHAQKIVSAGTLGTVHEINVAEEAYGIGIDIKKDGKFIRRSNIKDESKKITLVYYKDKQHKDGHYDLLVGEIPARVTSKHGDCLYAAIAEGLNSLHGSNKYDEHQVREHLFKEILDNPHRWHGEYRRKQSRENSWFWFRRGHLIRGAGGVQHHVQKLLTREFFNKNRTKILMRTFFNFRPGDAQTVGCVYSFKMTVNEKQHVFENSSTSRGTHAEENAISQICDEISKSMDKSTDKISQAHLEMVLSHSPCEGCRKRISSFFDDLECEQSNFTLHTARLYGKKELREEGAKIVLADWVHELEGSGVKTSLHHLDTGEIFGDFEPHIKDVYEKQPRKNAAKPNWDKVREDANKRAEIGRKDIGDVKKKIDEKRANEARNVN